MSGDPDLPPAGATARRAAAGRPRVAGRDPAGLSRELREGLRQRRPEALEAFYAAYFDRVYGYVRRMLRDEHLAEDLTQDIFMSIHRALSSYDPARDLRPWVFTIATNKLRDLWQSRVFQQGRRQVSLDDDEAGAPAPAVPADGPRESLEAGELGAAVAQAIELLPESLRVPFWLRWHEELSFEEIAAELDRSEVAVRKRYSRALAELRRLLGRWLPDEAGGEA
jgi:RNA polymerase sigma-70 factor (ECF subfamily)